MYHLNVSLVHTTLYLIRTVFLSDVLVPCSSESDILESFNCLFGSVGAEVPESETVLTPTA